MSESQLSRRWQRRNVLLAGMAGIGTVGLVGLGRGQRPHSYATAHSTVTSCTPPATLDLPRIGNFLGRSFDRTTDDASAALAAAARWSAIHDTAVVVDGELLLAATARIDAAGATLLFDCATLRVRDDIEWRRVNFGTTTPIGVHITANRVSLLGSCLISGLGIPGQTFLQGMFADEVSDLEVGNFTMQNLAIGQHFMCCDRVVCGETRAFSMWGLQGDMQNSNGAGSAQVISGCRQSKFARLTSINNDKPARYLSVGRTSGGQSRNNRRNHYGFANVTSRAGSPWCQVTAVRSSVDSVFEGGSGKSVNYLLNLQKYETDDDYVIDGNDFGDWSGSIRNSPDSSLDCAMQAWVSEGARGIGANRIGRIHATIPRIDPNFIQKFGVMLPRTFGLLCNSGRWTIGSLSLEGFTFGIQASDCQLNIGSMEMNRTEFSVARFGRGATGRIERLLLRSPMAEFASDKPYLTTINVGRSSKQAQISIAEVDMRGMSPGQRSNAVIDNNTGWLRLGSIIRN